MILALLTSALQLPIGGSWEETHLIQLGYYGEYQHAQYCGLDDVNADGSGDFALVARIHEAGWYRPPPALHLFSGRTGERLMRISGPSGEYLSGDVAPAGDANGDGVPDVLVGSDELAIGGLYQVGSVFLFSGADGSVISRADGLYEFDRLGATVAAIGDLNGDGVTEYFAASPNAYRSSASSGAGGIFSGATGARLLDMTGDAVLDYFGSAACGVGDWDGDLTPDFAVSAPYSDLPGMEDVGSVRLISGATMLEIHRWHGLSQSDSFGSALAAIGDANGDGMDDLLVGAPNVTFGGERSVGAAYLISGASRQVIGTWQARGYGASLGTSLAAAGDQDLDGAADFYLGAPGRRSGPLIDAGQIFLISGLTGAVLHVLAGPEAYTRWGLSLADGGDLDGDRSRHLMLAANSSKFTDPDDVGFVRIWSLQPFLAGDALEVSAAAGGNVAFDLNFPTEAAGQFAQILLSRSGTGPTVMDGSEIPLTYDALFQRSLSRSYPSYCTGFLSVLGPHGDAGASMDLEPGQLPPALVGTTLHFAAITRRLNGAITHVSRAHPLLIQP